MTTKEKIVLNYLNNNYKIGEKRLFNSLNEEEWGYQVVNLISTMFSLSDEFAEQILLEWIIEFGLNKEDFSEIFKPKKLKVSWNPELVNDLRVLYGIDSVHEILSRQIAEEISREINSEILKTLIDSVKTIDDLDDVSRCVGYKGVEVIDENNFVPKMNYMSTTRDETLKARKNSRLWKNI